MPYSSPILITITSVLSTTVYAGHFGINPIPWNPPSCEQGVGYPINTTSGLVSGHAAPNASTVSEYLGIPYAVPPLGELRFAPPVRYYGSGNLSGEATGRICPQADLGDEASATSIEYPTFLGSLAGIGQQRSEDCLTINVWTKHERKARPKPVLVWIYGGM